MSRLVSDTNHHIRLGSVARRCRCLGRPPAAAADRRRCCRVAPRSAGGSCPRRTFRSCRRSRSCRRPAPSCPHADPPESSAVQEVLVGRVGRLVVQGPTPPGRSRVGVPLGEDPRCNCEHLTSRRPHDVDTFVQTGAPGASPKLSRT